MVFIGRSLKMMTIEVFEVVRAISGRSVNSWLETSENFDSALEITKKTIYDKHFYHFSKVAPLFLSLWEVGGGGRLFEKVIKKTCRISIS